MKIQTKIKSPIGPEIIYENYNSSDVSYETETESESETPSDYFDESESSQINVNTEKSSKVVHLYEFIKKDRERYLSKIKNQSDNRITEADFKFSCRRRKLTTVNINVPNNNRYHHNKFMFNEFDISHSIHLEIFKPYNVPLSISIALTRYRIIGQVARKMGWKVVRGSTNWNILWADSVPGVELYKEMKRFQKINHFPGMQEICRKDLLARNLGRMLKLFPQDYNFYPKTWIFPADLGEAQNFNREHKRSTFILKPDTGWARVE